MPRTYIRKKVKSYNLENLAQAIEKVKSGELTQYAAATKYKIPLTTLHDHVKGISAKPNPGRPTALRIEEECQLAEAIITMEKWGFGLSRFETMDIVADYVRINNIPTPFKNNIPGPDWFINFRKRHGLSIKKAQPVEYLRKKMTDPFIIAEYFKLLESTLKNLNLFEKPQRIWNMDETSLCLDPSKTKVVGKKNKPCARTTHGSGKENITVLTGANASGEKLPPLIVYKGKFVWDTWMADINPNEYDFEISYAASSKGWMETDIFFNYMEKIVFPNLGEERPVLIIYDGHSTHVDVRVVELAIKNNVTILKLPPHTSHLLQPLDIAVFKSFKVLWDAKLVDWQRRNIGTKMPKNIFAHTLADTWQETNIEVIKNGFRKAGVYPFNANMIPVEIYDPNVYKKFQQKMKESQLFQTQLSTESPKTLRSLCIDMINKHLPDNNYVTDGSNSECVSLLSACKSDIQNLRFVAKDPSQLPACLQEFNTVQNKKINIISNVLIKKAPQTLRQPPPSHILSTSFEELLLEKIKQDKKNNIPTRKVRVTKGAEVITATIGKQILENKKKIEKDAINKNRKNLKKEKQKEVPGTSGGKKIYKRKRKQSVDSISSESDIIMSEHSDSDIVDFEDLIDQYLDDDFTKIYQDGPRAEQEMKNSYSTRKQILNKTNENCREDKVTVDGPSSFSFKGKGVGKRSKGKENEVDRLNMPKVGKQEKDGIQKNVKDHDDDGDELKRTNTNPEKDLNLPNEIGQVIANDDLRGLQERNLVETKDYKLNDAVLVRYLIRKKWKNFIGFIIKQEGTEYTIDYLKTVKTQQHLTFVATKKKDIDKVPEILIVKKIDLQRNNNNGKEYCLCNFEDSVYF